MGKSGAGKTSMRSIIFSSYIPRDTSRLGATIDIEHSHVRFLGNMILNLWDLGGQQSFMNSYITSQKDQVFRNVEILIYVFDSESREFEVDLQYYESIIDGILQGSKDAKVFIMLHKMDLIPVGERLSFITQKQELITSRSKGLIPTLFATSIWDESLYQAWSSIVYTLVPNIERLENELEKFCKLCEASEVVLFEKSTFLMVSHTKQSKHDSKDSHRFEKLSNIIKHFKLSCAYYC